MRPRTEDVRDLVSNLTYAQKVDRALGLLREAREEFRDGLFVANSLGKDSCVVWDLARRVDPEIQGFAVTTRYKPAETVAFMEYEKNVLQNKFWGITGPEKG